MPGLAEWPEGCEEDPRLREGGREGGRGEGRGKEKREGGKEGGREGGRAYLLRVSATPVEEEEEGQAHESHLGRRRSTSKKKGDEQ